MMWFLYMVEQLVWPPEPPAPLSNSQKFQLLQEFQPSGRNSKKVLAKGNDQQVIITLSSDINKKQQFFAFVGRIFLIFYCCLQNTMKAQTLRSYLDYYQVKKQIRNRINSEKKSLGSRKSRSHSRRKFLGDEDAPETNKEAHDLFERKIVQMKGLISDYFAPKSQLHSKFMNNFDQLLSIYKQKMQKNGEINPEMAEHDENHDNESEQLICELKEQIPFSRVQSQRNFRRT